MAALIAFASSRVLQCDFNFYDWKNWSDGEHYTCDAKNLVVLEPSQTFVSSLVEGKHFKTKQNVDVLVIKIENQNMRRVISGFKKFFPNVVELYVHASQLKEIERSDFKDLSSIKVMSFFGNQLSSIPSDTFMDTVNLEYLKLSWNHINTLPGKVFHPLINLKGLYLNGNDLSELSHSLLEKNTKIEEIWLQINKFNFIDENAFNSMKNLKTVMLVRNVCISKNFEGLNVEKVKKMQNELASACGSKKIKN